MSEYQILYFGTVNALDTNERYDASTNIDGYPVTLDLHFDERQLAPDLDATINQFLEKIATFNEAHRAVLRGDYDADGETLDYIRFFLDELGPRDLRRMLGDQFDNLSAPIQLLGKLQPVRIGVYPDAEGGFLAIFDYSLAINGQPSQQVLAIETDEQGEVLNIVWES